MWRFSGFGNEAPIGSIVARRATPFAGTKLELFSRKAVVPLGPAVDDFFLAGESQRPARQNDKLVWAIL